MTGELFDRTMSETIALHETMRKGGVRSLPDAAAAIVSSLQKGGTLLVFGNGGSASDAQRLPSELVGRFQRELDAARVKGLGTIALTGRDGGAIGKAAAIHVNVPGESTARVQEVHRTLLHVLCDLIERALS